MTVQRLRVKIGGMSCSFCTTTIQKAYSRMDGVKDVYVSLAHEEALIEYSLDFLARHARLGDGPAADTDPTPIS